MKNPLPLLFLFGILLFLIFTFFLAAKPSVDNLDNQSAYGCMEGESRKCTVGECRGSSFCRDGKWSTCRWNTICTPGTMKPCTNDGCAYAYKECNVCGTGYGPCLPPKGSDACGTEVDPCQPGDSLN